MLNYKNNSHTHRYVTRVGLYLKIETSFYKYPLQQGNLVVIEIAKLSNESLSILTVWFNTIRVATARITVSVLRKRSDQQ